MGFERLRDVFGLFLATPFVEMSLDLQEFLEVRFASPRIPEKIEVYEQYLGAIAKILGRGSPEQPWVELWSGPAKNDSQSDSTMKTFAPTLKKIGKLIQDVRLEYLDPKRTGSYPHCNGIALIGSKG